MKSFLFPLLASLAVANVYDMTLIDIDGNKMPMSQFKGNVTLFVNTARL